MNMLRRGIALAVTAGSLFLTSGIQTATRVVGPRGGDGSTPSSPLYLDHEREYYLTQDQLDFVKPGYVMKINSGAIGGDRKPVVDVNITDNPGSPIDRNGSIPRDRPYGSFPRRVKSPGGSTSLGGIHLCGVRVSGIGFKDLATDETAS
jgi:hypothetical protein